MLSLGRARRFWICLSLGGVVLAGGWVVLTGGFMQRMQLGAGAYVSISLLLDNSPSMLAGATAEDIHRLEAATACSPMAGSSGAPWVAWTAPPLPAVCPVTYEGRGINTPRAGFPPRAAPCGLACHWSENNQTLPGTNMPDYSRYDYYYLARHLVPAPVLRFDAVQAAAATMVTRIQAGETVSRHFRLGVWGFNSGTDTSPSPLHRLYPQSGESGSDLAAARQAIMHNAPPITVNNGFTDFPGALSALGEQLAPGGDGRVAAHPRKALVIVTDGIQDYGDRQVGDTLGPMDNPAARAACAAVKARFIRVLVLYTAYAPMANNPFYVHQIEPFLKNPPAPNTVVRALQGCASAPGDVVEADTPDQVSRGLQHLLEMAASGRDAGSKTLY
jgi:hypothetical protein